VDTSVVVDICSQALWVTLLISGPLLLVGLVVGLLIGVLQAVTQIHEMTLTFIPKILAVFATIVFLLPWMTMTMLDYTINLFNKIPTIYR
jgi:flagellar biosynthetic protein FliQ